MFKNVIIALTVSIGLLASIMSIYSSLKSLSDDITNNNIDNNLLDD